MENITEPQTPEQDPPSLTLVDLASMKNILDAACQRGAFKGNEMKAVGEVYSKLDAFLAAVAPKVTTPDQQGITPIQDPAMQHPGDNNAVS